ncbi:MAG: hypothetical protein IPO01_11465 [Chitinophagaceae bacterium]|nr:hypothetical protein [Chitinophagaceae bacterium]
MKKIISFAHIAKSLSILHIMLFYLISTKAQTPSVIQKVNVFGHYSRHTITKLNFLRPDKYNIAVDYQLGVIGNDFWGEQKLPNNYNDNSFEKTLTSTNYHAVNGYKGTLSGKLVMHGFRREGGKR